MKIAAIQHDIVWEDGSATQARLTPLIGQAAAGGARLIVLSEMYATGFSMQPQAIAEQPGGANQQFLIEQAAQHGVWIVGSIAQWVGEQRDEPGDGDQPDSEKLNRQAQNVAVLAGPDGQLHRYAKIHPFSYAGEDKFYRAGTDFLTVTVEDLRVSIFICYDLRFADEFWQLAADTDLYVVVANWPEPRSEHWRALLKARAIENQAYLLGCNRVGTGDGIRYLGDSTIIDPLGRNLVEASQAETVLLADADPGEVKRVRDRFPFLADRRQR
ncbi:MAG: carbon-nitrogen family hydrolase [Actinomycetota bacterium]|nr:carbon-nitrogen family hydrolase [Actinomycetota bacterium]MDQ2959019.1 carbon-nitrogen family hydrolase [Actinomycetota bacterium]